MPLRSRACGLVIASFLLVAVLGDLLASGAPIALRQDGKWYVLPAVTAPGVWGERGGTHVSESTQAIWPILRATGSDHTGRPKSIANAVAQWVQETRVSVCVAGVVALLAVGAGTALGALAALGPKVAERSLARLVELSGALPAILLVFVVQAIGESRLLGFVGVLSLLRAVETARIVRVRALASLHAPFCLAARALGVSTPRLFFKHFMPHLLPGILISGAFAATATLALDAAMAFVGLGIPVESWGTAIGRAARTGTWGAALAAVLSIIALSGALHLLAEDTRRRFPRVLGGQQDARRP